MTASSGGAVRQPVRRLHGPERVAALLLAMGKPVAERLLPYFEPEELRDISGAAATLGTMPSAELESLIEEFANQFAAGLNLLVSAREMKDLLTGAIPPEKTQGATQDAPEAADRRVWEQVAQMSEDVFATYLAGEHPQAVALILSRLDPQKAARLIADLPAGLRDETVRRMIVSKPPTDAAIGLVAAALREDLLLNPARTTGADPHERLARIINNLDRDAMEGVMQSLGTARPQSAEVLKGMLFTFEDIVRLTPRARTVLLDQVPGERLVLALKGTDDDFRETVLSALPARARRVVESELGRKEAASQRDVADSRREIVRRALDLAARGEIELKASTEEQSDLMIA